MRQGAEDIRGGATEQHREEGDLGVGRDTSFSHDEDLGFFLMGYGKSLNDLKQGAR